MSVRFRGFQSSLRGSLARTNVPLARASLGRSVRKVLGVVIVPIALTLGLAFFLGCSSEVTCKDACACEGLAGDKLCLSRCTDAQTAAQKSAADHGCGAQQEKFATCTADNAKCDSTKLEYTYPSTSCTAESSALTKCLGGQGGTSSSTGSN